MRQPSGQRYNIFPSCFSSKVDASSVFTGYVFGCKPSLQLKQEGQEALNRSPEYTDQKSNI